MSKNVVVALVIIIVLALAGWFLLKPQNQSSTKTPTNVTLTPTPTATQSPTPAATKGAMMEEKKMNKNIVNINSNGFSPKNVTIKVGESVTWVNKDSEDHTVNSDPHPTHTSYPPLNLGLIKPGDQKSLTFDQAGTYKYHDHLNPSLTGSVTVE